MLKLSLIRIYIFDLIIKDKDSYTLNYENLVNDTLHQIKSLLKVCNLEFDNNCLEYYKNKNAVFTTSSAQVREKISDKMVNSYKKYYLYLHNFFDSLDKL